MKSDPKKLIFINSNNCETITVSPRYRSEVCSTMPQRLRTDWSNVVITDCYNYGTPNKDFVECCTAWPFNNGPIPIHQNVKFCSGIQPSGTSTIRSYKSGTDDCYRQIMEYRKYCINANNVPFDKCTSLEKCIGERC